MLRLGAQNESSVIAVELMRSGSASIDIGPGQESEIDQYLTIRTDAFTSQALGTYTASEVATLLDRDESSGMRAMILDGQFFVARILNEVVGLAGWRDTNLYNLYVDPEHMRQGIGSSLLHAVETQFASRCPSNTFHIDAGLYTRPFYESQGYAVTRVATSSDGLKYLEMQKTIR